MKEDLKMENKKEEGKAMKEINIKIKIDNDGNRIGSIFKAKGFKSQIELHLELIGSLFWLLSRETNKISGKGFFFNNKEDGEIIFK